jgi:hypothetical protein
MELQEPPRCSECNMAMIWPWAGQPSSVLEVNFRRVVRWSSSRELRQGSGVVGLNPSGVDLHCHAAVSVAQPCSNLSHRAAELDELCRVERGVQPARSAIDK